MESESEQNVFCQNSSGHDGTFTTYCGYTIANIEKLESVIQERMDEMSSSIREMQEFMKDEHKIGDLIGVIYARRQDFSDYYFDIVMKLNKVKNALSKAYKERYEYYKTSTQYRIGSESAYDSVIRNDLAWDYYMLSLFDTYSKFIYESINNIDKMIYGINNMVRLIEMKYDIRK